MSAEEQLKDDLYDLVAPLVPKRCAITWAKESAPRPAKPYVVLDFLTYGRRIGQDEQRQTENGFTVVGLREFILSVNCYGEGAHDILQGFQQGLAEQKTIAAFGEANISSVSESEIRELTAKVDQRWEPRTQMDVTLYRTVSAEEDLDYFDKAIINGVTVD